MHVTSPGVTEEPKEEAPAKGKKGGKEDPPQADLPDPLVNSQPCIEVRSSKNKANTCT